jgi:hypothetical protein
MDIAFRKADLDQMTNVVALRLGRAVEMVEELLRESKLLGVGLMCAEG